MKKRALLLLFSLVALCTFAEKESLRIMSYNMPQTKDGILAWTSRYPYVQKYLLTIKPDVLGMQEPVRQELLNLLAGMPNYSMLGRARDNGIESGEYSPIFYRTDKYYVEHSGTYWLSTTPDVAGSKNWNSACVRIATWGIFRDKKTQARFLYTNTHLDHKSDSARTHQMEVIKEQMQKITQKYGSMPMMITGDFNVYSSTSGAYTSALNYLIPMKDAWTSALSKEGNGYTFPAEEATRKIDYIIISKEITSHLAVTQQTETVVGEILSDHRPHWADISWQTSTEEDFNAILAQGREAYDSVFYYTPGTEKLITNATDGNAGCQISHDGAETSQGQYTKYLIDNNVNTFFHSLYSTAPPSNPHYLQVDLKRDDVRAFHFTYERRNDATYGIADRWKDVLITASNDGVNWDYITELLDFGGDALKLYPSDVIDMMKPYRHVRFSVMHTPENKIRNGHPQFTCSEFQMYLGTLNDDSQYLLNDEVKTLADKLKKLYDSIKAQQEAGTSITTEQKEEFKSVLGQLRSIMVNHKKLSENFSEASSLMDTYPVGTSYGNVSAEAYATYQNALTNIQSAYSLRINRATADSLMTELNKAKAQYLNARITFAPNKWYYIQCEHLNKTIKQEMYGQVLYADGASTSAELKAGLYNKKQSILYAKRNPSAMWRIVPMEDGSGYAIQNRCSGCYLGALDKSGSSFVVSQTPVAYNVDLRGVDDFHFSPVATPESSITVTTDSTIVPANGGFHSASSWIFTEVVDSEIGTVDLPMRNHSLTIVTLPFAAENITEKNPNIKTYSLVSMPVAGTFHLKRKNSFAAGEPFFLLTGTVDSLDANCTSTINVQIVPPQDYVSEATVVNGLHGVLTKTAMTKTGYYMLNNAVKLGKVSLNANTGYILRTEVQTTGTKHNLEISTNGTIKEVLLLGDLNDDGLLNVGDLTQIIGLVMSDNVNPDLLKVADMNADTVLNVGDITSLVKEIMAE